MLTLLITTKIYSLYVDVHFFIWVDEKNKNYLDFIVVYTFIITTYSIYFDLYGKLYIRVTMNTKKHAWMQLIPAVNSLFTK